MSATIRIFDEEARLEDWEWHSEDKVLADWLNAHRPTFGPSGADPNPDLHEAMRIVEEYEAELLTWEPMPFERDVEY